VETPPNPDQRAVQLLAAFEVLSFPLDITALSGHQYIHFMRVAGTNPTPLKEHFPNGQLKVGDKLAGNELKNFAAFYKASWRANDWMWGRLDAATSLMDLLVRPSAIRQHYRSDSSESEQDSFERMVKELVTADPPYPADLSKEEKQQWKQHFEQLWENSQAEVQDELQALFERPDDDGSVDTLTTTKELLVARRHWELLLSELPDVVRAAATGDLEEGLPPTKKPRGWWSRKRRRRLKEESLMQAAFAAQAEKLDPLRQPEGVKRLLRSYRVGSETVLQEMGRDRFTWTVANFLVVAWNALTNGRNLGFLRPVGWALRLLRVLALAVVQAPNWFLFGALGIIGLGTYVTFQKDPWFGISRVLAATAVVATAAMLYYWFAPIAREVFFGLILAAVALVAFNLSGQISLRLWGGELHQVKVDRIASLLVLVGVPLLWMLFRSLWWRILRWWRDRPAKKAEQGSPSHAR
jgi:hypothetical protein